jgi:hypothetical protein
VIFLAARIALATFVILFGAWLWSRTNAYVQNRGCLAWFVRFVVVVLWLAAFTYALRDMIVPGRQPPIAAVPTATPRATVEHPLPAATGPVQLTSSSLSISTLPTATPAPRVLWICADIAYGYTQPDTRSPVVWQMSAGDGWFVTVYEKVGRWYSVGGENGIVYMDESTLCANPPGAENSLTPVPSPGPDVCAKPRDQMTPAEISLCAQKSALATPQPTPTPGQGILIVVNHYGSEMNYSVGDTLYVVPANGERVIYLPSGTHRYSVEIAGVGDTTGTIEMEEGKFIIESWAAHQAP